MLTYSEKQQLKEARRIASKISKTAWKNKLKELQAIHVEKLPIDVPVTIAKVARQRS